MPSTWFPEPLWLARRHGDPYLAPNMGLASTSSSVGRLPQSAMLYEQAESALVGQGKVMVPGSDTSVKSHASQGSEETLSPNQDRIFSYRARSQPLGSDIEPLIWAQATKFFQNLDQLDILAVIAGTAGQVDPSLGTRPRTSETQVNLDLSSTPAAAGPSQPAPTDF